MELNLLRSPKIRFRNPRFRNDMESESKKKKVDSISKTTDSSYSLSLYPVIGDGSDDDYSSIWTGPFRENWIDLLFGNTDLTKTLNKGRSATRVLTHLTLTSSNTGTLMIETKTKDDHADIFEGLLNLQETLAQNSIEFILSVKGFRECSGYSDSDDEAADESLDFNWKGLKLTRNEDGSASLEVADIHFPEEMWWEHWSGEWATFLGIIAINVRLEICAVAELYKRNFRGGPSTTATQLGSTTDMVILVGGNKDKEKAIKCHKAILSEMSPVFEAMFRTDMLEAKEGALEIVEFSEAVIRALMEYAYRRNMEDALKSSEMTLELLRIADKYQMMDLTDMLLHIIWSMPMSWFPANVALKLFFFAKNCGKVLAQAEEKAWNALKWYAKKYPEKLLESKESVEFVGKNPGAVMELLVQLLSKCH